MTDWDRIITSAPMDAKAATVAGGKGEAPLDDSRYNGARSHAPLPTRPVPDGAPDLTGQRFGRFTVVGLGAWSENAGKNAPVVWVVRCACGAYETRRAKILRAPGEAMCSACRHLLNLQKSASTARSRERKRAERYAKFRAWLAGLSPEERAAFDEKDARERAEHAERRARPKDTADP